MERFCAPIQNVTVGTTHLNSTKIVFEPFVAGAVFFPPGVAGNLLFWGGCPDTPSGVGLSGSSDYPAAASNSSPPLGTNQANYAPIVNAAGGQVAINGNGGGDGQWYVFPAECRPFGSLKLTSGTITGVAVVLKS